MLEFEPAEWKDDPPANLLPAGLDRLRGVAGASEMPLVPQEADEQGAGAQAGPSAAPARAGPGNVGVIDTGLAFWNPVFGAADPQLGPVGTVEAMAYMGLSGGLSVSPLPRAEMDALHAMGRRPGGDARARARLGALFPDSIHAGHEGGPPLISPEAFAHGTAIASLAGAEAGSRTPIFGLELPAAALVDSSGATLEAILPRALRELIDLILGAPGRAEGPIAVVLPLAFLGGPHDPDRPVLARLRAILRAHRRRGADVTLIVSAGNHRTERVRAALDANGARDGLAWRLMPDDHSANAVDLVHGEEAPAFELTGPHGAHGALPAGALADLMLIREGGRAIGALWRQALPDGRYRTRLALAPTAASAPGPSCHPGRWRIAMPGAARLDAWILRDDAVIAGGRLPPRRQSAFEDAAYRPTTAVRPAVEAASGVTERGTASVLTAGTDAEADRPLIVASDAMWAPAPARPHSPAPYAGRLDGEGEPARPLVDVPRPREGRLAVATGTRRKMRVSGTSAGAALVAGRLAAGRALDG